MRFSSSIILALTATAFASPINKQRSTVESIDNIPKSLTPAKLTPRCTQSGPDACKLWKKDETALVVKRDEESSTMTALWKRGCNSGGTVHCLWKKAESIADSILPAKDPSKVHSDMMAWRRTWAWKREETITDDILPEEDASKVHSDAYAWKRMNAWKREPCDTPSGKCLWKREPCDTPSGKCLWRRIVTAIDGLLPKEDPTSKFHSMDS